MRALPRASGIAFVALSLVAAWVALRDDGARAGADEGSPRASLVPVEPRAARSGELDDPAGPTAAGTRSDVAFSSTRSDALALDGVLVHVVDAGTGAPIPRATLVLACGFERTPIELAADEHGVVRLGERGRCAATVRAPGYGSVTSVVSLDASFTVALERAATLDLVFVDARGVACEGVRATLLPPGAWPASPSPTVVVPLRRPAADRLARDVVEVRWDATVERKPHASDANGLIRWDDLAPGEGWRWRADSFAVEEVLPRSEPREELAFGGMLSGTFPLRAGQHESIVVRCRALGEIRGRIVGPDGEPRGAVSVSWRASGDPSRRDEWMQDVCDAEGRFALRNVPAASGTLRAWFETAPSTYVLVERSLRLAPGEHLDLGDVAPLATRLAIFAAVIGPGGGALEAPRASPVEALAVIASRAPLAPLQLAVPFGGRALVFGLVDGPWDFVARGDPEDHVFQDLLVLEVPPWPRASLAQAGANDELELALHVAPRVDVLVRAPPLSRPGAPEQSTSVGLSVVLKSASGAIHAFEMRALLGLEFSVRRKLPPGEYECLAVEMGEGARHFARQHVLVAIEPEATLDLELRAGRELHGRCIDATGASLRERDVAFTLEEFASGDASTFAWRVRTDGEGRFRIGNVPSSGVLACERGTSRFDLSASGAATFVLRD